jgi:hypothetical protein
MKKTLFDRTANPFSPKIVAKNKSPRKSKENAENEDDKPKEEDEFEDLDTLIKSKVYSSISFFY